MTLNECRREVALLGGDLEEPLFPRFAAALMRALYTLAGMRPRFVARISERGHSLGDKVMYDMTEEDPDFLAFAPSPVLPPADYHIFEGNKIILPNDGIAYRIFYKRKIPSYKESDGDKELPPDDEAARLLPLMIAAEVYADEDAELSASCLALYRTAASGIFGKRESPQSAAIFNLNGW